MKTFLEELAGHIWLHYAGMTDQLCIVLPNKRAGLYLQQFIAREAGKALWAPRITSIEQLIGEKTGLHFPDHFALMGELYEVHRALRGEQADPFTEFMHWGSTLIRDFNDTDLYLADAKQLFTYLDASRAIATWNPDGRPLSEFQTNYLSFYQSLLDYYEALGERLSQQQRAYPGLAFRKAASDPALYFKQEAPVRYVFAGFNALTPAEEKIIRYLLDEGKAECLWDADEYYLNDVRQEAGLFLRKYRDEWSSGEFLRSGTGWSQPKKINIAGVAGHVAQAKVCGDLLQALDPNEINQTCVVLADESLLLPVLNSIPEFIKTFNITMGFPIRQSPLHTLMIDILSLHENAQRTRALYGDDRLAFTLVQATRILQHPYVISWAGKTKDSAPLMLSLALSQKLRDDLSYYLSPATLEKETLMRSPDGWEKLSLIFGPWNKEGSDVLACVESLLRSLQDHYAHEEGAALEREYLFQYLKLLQGVREILAEHTIPADLATARMVLSETAASSSLPFYGEPLSGLQLMGVLETRNLDFKNIILLSANDETLPGTSSQNSFIPQDIRNDFGLPSYKQKEAVYAYHFYRLMQRSQNISLLYNTQPGHLSSGEKSRFIAQIEHEIPQYNNQVRITDEILSMEPILHQAPLSICIEKTPEIIALIADRGQRGFAPSTLNAYLECPLRFYFQEILRLKEEDEASSSMDAATLGTTLHNTLEKLYQPWLGEVLTAHHYDHMADSALPALKEEFTKNLRGGDARFGKNLLLSRVAETYLQNFLNIEREQTLADQRPRKVEYVEKHLETQFKFGPAPEQEVKVKGRADRIDSTEGNICIIDYKTGKVDLKELQWRDLNALLSSDKKAKGIQLLMYAWLFHRQHAEHSGPLESGIISFRALKNGVLRLQFGDSVDISTGLLQEFETWLAALFRELFDPAQTITQTTDTTACRYCSFSSLCFR